MVEGVANLSIKQMRAVQAVARSSSFLAASVELRMSQPGISRLVRATEDELGVQLFHRSTRQVILTAEGLAFLPAIERILAEFDHSVSNLVAIVQDPGCSWQGSNDHAADENIMVEHFHENVRPEEGRDPRSRG